MSILFISYSSNDRTAAEQLRLRLLKFGYERSQLFLDSDADSGIPAGANWERVLYDRLRDCEALLVLVSRSWCESRWCFAELMYARQAGKSIFPIVLEDGDWEPLLSQRQAVFPYRDAEAYERLLSSLDNNQLGPKDRFPWNPERCPFPGMPAFDESMAAVYVGRERETQELLESLRKMRSIGEPRFLLIVGGSGSGKSSLLRAGLLPRLGHKSASTDWIVLPTLRFAQTPDLLQQLALSLSDRSRENGSVLSRALAQHTLRVQIQTPDTVYSLALSADGSRLATRYSSNTLELWNADTGDSLGTFDIGQADFRQLLFVPDGSRLVLASRNDTEVSVRTWDMKANALVSTATDPRADVRAMAVSGDGEVIATAVARGVRVWDRASGRTIWELSDFPVDIDKLVFSPSGQHLLIAGDRAVQVRRAADQRVVIAPQLNFRFLDGVAFSRSGDLLAIAYSREGQEAGDLDHALVVLATDTGREVLRRETGDDTVRALVFSHAGDELLTVDETFNGPRHLRIWRIGIASSDDSSPPAKQIVLGARNAPQHIDVSDDGKRILMYTDFLFPTVTVRDAETDTELDIFHGHHDLTRLGAMSRDGSTIVTSGEDRTVRIWRQAEPYSTITTLDAPLVGVTAVDGRTILALQAENSLAFVDLSTGHPAIQLPEETSGFGNPFSPDGKLVATYHGRGRSVGPASRNADVTIRRLPRWEVVRRFQFDTASVTQVGFGPDSSHVIAIAANAGQVFVGNITTGEVTQLDISRGFTDPDAFVKLAHLAPDGSQLLILEQTLNRLHPGFQAGSVQVWDVKGHKQRHTLRAGIVALTAAWSPDGVTIVTGNTEGNATVWNAESGGAIRELSGHTDAIRVAAFSPRGSEIATLGRDGTARLWSANTGEEIGILRMPIDVASLLQFSPDGSRLLIIGSDRVARVWDVETKLVVHMFDTRIEDQGSFDSILWLPDSRAFVTRGPAGTIRTYPNHLAELLRMAERVRTRIVPVEPGRRTAVRPH